MNDDSTRLVAIYEVNFDIAFVVWNLNTYANERILGITLNLIDPFVSILYVDLQKFYVHNGTRILFFEFDQDKEDPLRIEQCDCQLAIRLAADRLWLVMMMLDDGFVKQIAHPVV